MLLDYYMIWCWFWKL